MSASTLPTDCPNCGTQLTGDYCHACGQKRAPVNPTVSELLTELAESVTSVDGKLLRSLKLLVTSPGQLTHELLEGRRASFVTPLRLYLSFSVLYFAVAAYVTVAALPGSGSLMDVRTTGRPSSGWNISLSGPGADRTTEQQSEADREVERDLERQANEAIIVWTPRLMFVLVPLFAALVGLTVRKAGRNYPQHLYMSLHLHAAWFLVAAVSTAVRLLGNPVVSQIASTLALLYGATYFILTLKRTYDLSTAGALSRAAGIGVLYFLIVLSTMLGVALPIILRANGGSGAGG